MVNISRKHLLAYFGATCAFCGSTSNLEVDHIIPRSWGGTDEPKNLRVLCKACHTIRHARKVKPPKKRFNPIVRKIMHDKLPRFYSILQIVEWAYADFQLKTPSLYMRPSMVGLERK